MLIKYADDLIIKKNKAIPHKAINRFFHITGANHIWDQYFSLDHLSWMSLIEYNFISI